jgi:hypothetical protein
VSTSGIPVSTAVRASARVLRRISSYGVLTASLTVPTWWSMSRIAASVGCEQVLHEGLRA